MRRLLTYFSLSLMLLLLSFGAIIQGQDTLVHVVQRGDNLFRISLRYNVPMNQIAAANGILNYNLIYAGQSLVIPGASGGEPPDDPTPTPPPGEVGTYTVRPGDTLASIARRFNTTYPILASFNGIANPNLIFVGQVLQIPGGGGDNGGDDGGDDGGDNGGNPPPTNPVTGFALGGHVLQGNYPYSSVMQNTGLTWAKRQIRWTQGTPASNFQGEIQAAKDRNFRILLGVVGDPSQLAANPTQYYQDYANFVGELAALGADAIEVWNEPNIDREWPSGLISGSQYTQMLRAAYQSIKARNPNTLVISGAPAPTGGLPNNPTNGYNDDVFIGQMASAGAASVMDCVGIHYNAGAVPPSATSGAPVGSSGHYSWYYPSMVNLYRGTFPSTPLCFTEIGYLSNDDFSQPMPGGFAWADGTSVAEHAQWLAQAAVRARNSGAVRLFIIWNVDATGFTDDPQAGYAMVRPDGSCPSCNTIQSAFGN